MGAEAFDVIVVGAGHGGAQAAIALRQNGFKGSIAIVGEEPHMPYERPPLSKEYLSGEKNFERILIRPPSFWDARGIIMLTGKRVVSVDPGAHAVVTESGEAIGYGRLIWAAGGHARKLSCAGHDLAGIHSVRTRADVDRMMSELSTTDQVAVIGAGYIGLEAAAVLVKMGKKVTVLEALDRVLARVAGEALSRFFEAEHRMRGVDLRLSATVDSILGKNGRTTGVRLVGGEIIEACMVIVGILPAVEPLLAAGAKGGNGVAVDSRCRTSLPGIFAVGDCALHVNPFSAGDSPIRLESVQNANDQAAVAAKTIAGLEARYNAVPWFWSNQYDLKLQTVGLSAGHDATVIRGDVANRSFSIIYLKQGSVIALDCVNAMKDYVQGRKLVAERLSPDPVWLANVERPLGEIASKLSA